MEITPPQLQLHWQVLLSAGISPTMTVCDPGAHGAAVAAATVGFDGDMHMPNGAIFTMGT